MSRNQDQINISNFENLNNNTAQNNRDTEELAQNVSNMELDSPTEVGNNIQNPNASTNCDSGKRQNDLHHQKNKVDNINENTNQKNTLNSNDAEMDIEENENQKINIVSKCSSIGSTEDIGRLKNDSQNEEDKISGTELNLNTNSRKRKRKRKNQ